MLAKLILGICVVLFIVLIVATIETVINTTNEKWWKFNGNKNFPFTWKGKSLWYSRSVAVTSFVFCKDKEDNWCILANKRGDGTPDFKGYWNVPCGYLEMNESGEECACRETFEETGLKLKKNNMFFSGLDTSPNSNRQNVSIYYRTILDGVIDDNSSFSKENMEKNEVDDIKWIKISDLDSFIWAFNHKKLIKEFFDMYIIGE